MDHSAPTLPAATRDVHTSKPFFADYEAVSGERSDVTICCAKKTGNEKFFGKISRNDENWHVIGNYL